MDTEEKPAKPEGVNSEAAQPAAPGLKVVESYTPRLRSGAEGAGQTMIDPLTKRVIPVEQANEHMRIELMDPMWKKQTAVRQERDATTNLASGAEMSDTIHRMRASQEKELGLKRAQPQPAQEASAQEIDEQLKRQRMRAMGIPPPPPAPAVSAAVPAAVSAPAMPAAPAALSGAAAPPKPPMAGHADPSCQSACARHACYAWYAHANAGHACYTHAHAGNPQHANAQYAYAEYARHAHFARHARHARYAHAHDGRYG